jgi:hypothetical protein
LYTEPAFRRQPEMTFMWSAPHRYAICNSVTAYPDRGFNFTLDPFNRIIARWWLEMEIGLVVCSTKDQLQQSNEGEHRSDKTPYQDSFPGSAPSRNSRRGMFV